MKIWLLMRRTNEAGQWWFDGGAPYSSYEKARQAKRRFIRKWPNDKCRVEIYSDIVDSIDNLKRSNPNV
jgi:hypothetical protein